VPDDKKKIRIGVLFGGRSGEHEVSLRSARSVMDAIDKDKYDVLPIGITKEGHWVAGGDPLKYLAQRAGQTQIESGAVTGEPMPAALIGEPGQTAIKSIEPASGGHAMRDIATVDVLFPVLHGTYGEDGTVQGLLELADIAYVGAGVAGSSVSMDKALFKAVMQSSGVDVLPYQLVLRSDWEIKPEAVLNALETVLTYPLFVKPANLGSSVGVSKARDRDSLGEALGEAALYDRRLLVEQGINAREIEVSVMGNENPLASVPGEIVPGDEFYSYKDKYIDDNAKLIIPAQLDEATTELIQETSIQAYRAVDCAGLARVDFLLDKDTGKPWLNEINTIPGFTSISMYPKLWEASGISYPELIERLIEYALDRHADKRRNKTTFDPDS